VVLNEIDADKILVTAIACLDGIDLGNGRSAHRLQLHIIGGNRRPIIDKLFPTRRAVRWCAANQCPLINAIFPDMHFIRARDDRPSVQVQHLAGKSHPVTTRAIGVVFQIKGTDI